MVPDKKDKNLKDLFDVAMSDAEENFTPLFSSLQEMTERYSNREVIASGGMKKIYKVLDKASDRYVALAKLHEDVAKEQYDSFIRESRLTAKLEHPNIMAVYDMGIIDGEPYFTMELKSGGSLEELLLKRQQMDENIIEKYKLAKLLGIFLKVCDAIAFAHSKNVLHLDLKPANIQVGDFGEVLVCDWGLGKIIDDADNAETDALLFNPDLLNHMTLNGHIKGTPGYMAPEQIGSGSDKTFQTDIYSLGAILYALLTDNCPYEGNTEEKLKYTLKGDLEAPSKRFPEKSIPAGLEAIILKAMEKDPTNRYESVLFLKRDVSQFISGYAPEAEDAGLVKQLTLFWHRNLFICLTSAAFLTILLVGLLIFISQLQKSRDLAQQQKIIAVENQRNAEAALRLYQKGKKDLEETHRQWSTDITVNTEPLRYHFFYESPKRYVKQTIEGLNRALKINPENQRAIGLLGHQYFLTQRFKQANEVFARSFFRQEDIFPISLDFAKLKEDSQLLTVNQLTEVIKRVGSNFNRRHHLSERLLAWDAFSRKDDVNYFKPVYELLVINNKGLRDFSLEYDEATSSALLRGARHLSIAEDNKIGSGVCLLRFLRLKSLKIEGDVSIHAQDLRGLLQLETLDISQATMNHVESLVDLPKLKRLIIKRGQLKDRHKKYLENTLGLDIID